MVEIVREFAGAERVFRVNTGTMLDLQEKLDVAIGALYLRVAGHGYTVQDVIEILTFSLRDGGMKADHARKLVGDRIDAGGIAHAAERAVEVLVSAFDGIKADPDLQGDGDDNPTDQSALFGAFMKMGVTPPQLRKFEYRDFVCLQRGLWGNDVKSPSEDEFLQMVREYEARHVE